MACIISGFHRYWHFTGNVGLFTLALGMGLVLRLDLGLELWLGLGLRMGLALALMTGWGLGFLLRLMIRLSLFDGQITVSTLSVDDHLTVDKRDPSLSTKDLMA